MKPTHIYTGPTTFQGLQARSKCRIVGKRAGGTQIQTANGRCWLVGRDELLPIRARKSARERVGEFVRAAA